MYTNSQYFYIKANDTLPYLQVMLMTMGDIDQVLPLNLSAVTACTFSMVDNAGNLRISNRPAIIPNVNNGIIQYQWYQMDTVQPGIYKGEFELYFSGSSNLQKMTVPPIGHITVEIFSDVNNK